MSEAGGMPGADVAAVIVNYRTPDLVSRCVAAVERSALRPQIVIVDNGSGDSTVAELARRHPGARIVARPRNDGYAAAVNAGFAATTAPFVVVLNADTEPSPSALDLLARHLESHPRVGVAAPRLVYPDGRPQPSAYRRFPNLLTLFVDFCAPLGLALTRVPRLHPHVLPPSESRRGGDVAHATGAALAIRRRAYDDVGPLDEGYFLYLEETEWQGRVRRRGWSVELVPEARVVHRVRGGGEAAHVPSPHYLPSAYRYLRARGTSETAIDVVLVASAVTSRLTLRTVAALLPSRRQASLRQAESCDDVLRYVRHRRAARRGRRRHAPDDGHA